MKRSRVRGRGRAAGASARSDRPSLREELRRFDGRHVAPLAALGSRLLQEADGTDELIRIASGDDERSQIAATWVLKWLQEQRVRFTAAQVRALLRSLDRAGCWEARLHLLQMLAGLEIPSPAARALHGTLARYVRDPGKLVRAWSYSGFFVLADQHPRFRPEVLGLLDAASEDEAASVRARVRRIRGAVGWAHAGPGSRPASRRGGR